MNVLLWSDLVAASEWGSLYLWGEWMDVLMDESTTMEGCIVMVWRIK